MKLTREFLSRSADEVAPDLLGYVISATIGDERVAIRLTEIEAYAGVGEDPASHAHRGRTPRNEVMFGPAGTAYVYFIYGMHWCVNVVTGPEGQAGAVLLRAGEVTEGLALARSRRLSARHDNDLARGPARLSSALGVRGEFNGVDLLDSQSPLQLSSPPAKNNARTSTSPRTGIAGEGSHTPWRYYLDADPTVSPYRPRSRRTPR